MRNVTLKRDDLKEKVAENRSAHREKWLKALEGWRKRSQDELETLLARVVAGDDVQVYISLPMPDNHEKDYDRAIAMLMWEQREELELTQAEFAQLVMDDWDWKQAFEATSASYIQELGR